MYCILLYNIPHYTRLYSTILCCRNEGSRFSVLLVMAFRLLSSHAMRSTLAKELRRELQLLRAPILCCPEVQGSRFRLTLLLTICMKPKPVISDKASYGVENKFQMSEVLELPCHTTRKPKSQPRMPRSAGAQRLIACNM